MTFRTTQPLQLPKLVLVRALVRAFLLLMKNGLNWAASIDDNVTRNAPLLSLERLFTLFRLSLSMISLMNKLQELWLITVALALPFLLPFALTASFALYSSRKLFIEFKELPEFKELQPISSDSCAPTVNIFCTHLLAPPFQLLFPHKSYSNSSWNLSFRLKRSLENNSYKLASRTFVVESLT